MDYYQYDHPIQFALALQTDFANPCKYVLVLDYNKNNDYDNRLFLKEIKTIQLKGSFIEALL